STMPPTSENLSPDQYLAVTAFILQSNGAQAGSQALTPTTAVPIGAAATRAGAAATQTAPIATTATDPAAGRGAGATAGRGGPPGGGRGGAPAAGVLGVTVAGTVKNYVPVTDEMLRNQDSGDWLMARRN